MRDRSNPMVQGIALGLFARARRGPHQRTGLAGEVSAQDTELGLLFVPASSSK